MLTANFLTESICDYALPPISGDGSTNEHNWQEFYSNIVNFTENASEENSCEEELHSLLNGIFSYSPYLTQCLLKEMAIFMELCQNGRVSALEKIYNDCETLLQDSKKLADEELLSIELRRLKRQLALVLGLCDMSGRIPLAELTESLTKFADYAVEISLHHMWQRFVDRDYLPEDAKKLQGIFILGMGKYGGYELNYSSDIDLILLFDAERLPFLDEHIDNTQEILNRGVKYFVKLLDEVNRDGFVFRVDLDLRPDPLSTPPIMSVTSALHYYSDVGQTWERAAFIKARVVAGDREAGDLFLQDMTPFIWRKSLDYYALNEIAEIRSRMLQTKSSGEGEHGIAGFNVKLSYGGIREVEFLIQSQQLIWGGRNPFLRTANGMEALRRMTMETILPEEIEGTLIESYHFLRQIEHRLQMLMNEQTQSLPKDDHALKRFAAWSGYDDVGEFAKILLAHVKGARDLSDGYGPKTLDHRDETDEKSAENAHLASSFTAPEFGEEADKLLQSYGFTDAATAHQIISGWLRGEYKATRSEKSIQHLTNLLPSLLQHIADSGGPDTTLVQFDKFLQEVPFGVQVFALLKAHPHLCHQLFSIMGGAPTIGTWLSANPHLLDALLEVQTFHEGDASLSHLSRSRISLQEILIEAKDIQDVIQAVSKWLNDQKFLCRIDFFNGVSDIQTLMKNETQLAEITIAGLLPQVIKEFNAGNAARKASNEAAPKVEDFLSILAFGKFGSGELLPLSDLDIVLIYDADTDADIAYGLQAMVYFVRLCQRILTVLSTESGDGKLYSVDMRLRPSGEKSAVATPLDRFTDYYKGGEAWEWEFMTLLRGRSVWGSDIVNDKIHQAIADIFTHDMAEETLVSALKKMWDTTRTTHKGEAEWDIKYRAGGLQDLEYVIYGLQLFNIRKYPDLYGKHGTDALQALQAEGIINEQEERDLSHAYLVWMTLSAALKLIGDSADISAETLTAAQIESLCRMLECSCDVSLNGDAASIQQLMNSAAEPVKEKFHLLFG